MRLESHEGACDDSTSVEAVRRRRSTAGLGPVYLDELPVKPLISAITLAELSAGPLVASSPEERSSRQAVLQQAEADFDPLPFDASAARAFGQVAASLRQAGRKTNARSYDAMIAAVALANGLPLYTANPSDYEGVGIEVRSVVAAR